MGNTKGDYGRKDEESSSSESDNEEESQKTKTAGSKSTSGTTPASPKNPLGFTGSRLASFKKSGLPSPGSTATTSHLKSTNTSVYASPRVQQAKTRAQESSSG